ncbi:hypothetical protein M404DRAFT_1002198 [Pisolithus tinctorius Marx 270]|uniref:Uncharacterized protein n=1 Tax=Pisolithus tinctorius Marx 270 TaxID=870435 RepID=A0A0C3NNX3_PISTI|nr:hypothetical protein M404DRAFT_1002198 [Pisolithus tinctorius Marx 270]
MDQKLRFSSRNISISGENFTTAVIWVRLLPSLKKRHVSSPVKKRASSNRFS